MVCCMVLRTFQFPKVLYALYTSDPTHFGSALTSSVTRATTACQLNFPSPHHPALAVTDSGASPCAFLSFQMSTGQRSNRT